MEGGASAAHRDAIDLLISDVVMPGMAGTALAPRIREQRPETRVLLLSGYSAELAGAGGAHIEGADFLGKPFTPDALLAKIDALLRR